jgi:predicted phosphodiesterase
MENTPEDYDEKTLPRKKLEIVAVSDTHGSVHPFQKLWQLKGDIFIHAGDFTDYGEEKDFLNFFKILDRLNFKHKIVIAGNHEISLDNGCVTNKKREIYLHKHPCSLSRQHILGELKKRCIYLEHEAV